MKIKKYIIFLLAFVVFMTNISYSLTIHYCKDSIASVALNSFVDEPCKTISDSCCALESMHDSCCSDKIVKVEKKQDNFLNKSLSFVANFALIPRLSPLEFNNNVVLFSSKENPSFYCDSNAPPIYKLNCQLVFYA